MAISHSPDAQTAYLDFSQFNEIKRNYRKDSDAGIKATAHQLEGVFLNMMLKSMRQANESFGEGNYLTSKESAYYRDMYDQQITSALANRPGIGLAEVIVRQMKQLEKGKSGHIESANPEPVNQKSYEISGYRERAIPRLLRQHLSELEQTEMTRDMERQTVEAALFAPLEPAPKVKDPAPSTWRTPAEFVDAILPHAQRAGQKLKVDPMAIVAQAVLETGWGQRVMRDNSGEQSFNLFGIKASSQWGGNTVNKKTLEYRNGIAAQEFAAFRSYASIESAFDDYVRFLQENPRYQQALEKNVDAKQWGYELQKAGYATDPKYGNKIASLLESDILQAKARTTTTTL